MRRGKIYLNDIYAGLLTEDENGFTFAYDAGFLRSGKAEAVSLTPVSYTHLTLPTICSV